MKGNFKHNYGRLYYQTFGSGEPLVFLHGFSLDHRMWQPQIEYFRHNHQVLVYDLRGYGHSSLPVDLYSHHDDLCALMEHLGVAKAHFVGLSFGGEVVIDMALSYPDRLKSMCLFDTSLGGFINTVDWNVGAREFGIKRAKDNWLKHAVFEQTSKNKSAFVKLQQIAGDYSGWHWLHRDPRERLDPPAIDRLGEISIPTLIAVGSLDLPYYHSIAKTLKSAVSKSSMQIIPDVGHMSTLESPEYCNDLIQNFVHNN